jgi:hypothetical protein
MIEKYDESMGWEYGEGRQKHASHTEFWWESVVEDVHLEYQETDGQITLERINIVK